MQDIPVPIPTTAAARPLDVDEERVTRARRRVVRLATALVIQPFDPKAYAQLRAYLESDADQVLASYRALCARPESELRERIAELTTKPSGARA